MEERLAAAVAGRISFGPMQGSAAQHDPARRVRRLAALGLALHLSATAALVAGWLATRGRGAGGVELLVAGPVSDPRVAALCWSAAWLLLGAALALVAAGRVRRDNAVAAGSFFLLAFAYVGALRERPEFGDVDDYIRAAQQLAAGEPFHPRYFYPPLWATCLQPLVPLGPDAMFVACHAANLLSLLLFFHLLRRALARFGYPPGAAALCTLAAFAANTPALRTLFYVQVNFHLANLVLGSLLLARRHAALSALAMALAVHLKISPALLALPFVTARRWRWTAAFAASLGGVALLTSLANDVDYYRISFENVLRVLERRRHQYSDTSLDSLVLNAYRVHGLDAASAVWVIAGLKLAVLAAGVVAAARSVRSRAFSRDGDDDPVLEGYVALAFPMLLLSPLLWGHHLVLTVLPMLVLARRLATAGEALAFAACWAAFYWLPVVDAWPLSYLKLLGLAVAFALVLRAARRPAGAPPAWIARLERAASGA